MRPLGPDPFIILRLIPNSLARRRTLGEANILSVELLSSMAEDWVISDDFFSSEGVAVCSVSSVKMGSSSTASVESEISILIRSCPVLTSSPAETEISVTVH